MAILSRRMSPDSQIRLGLWALIAANLSNWFLPRLALLSEAWVGAVTGMLFGIAIALLLCGLWRRRQQLSN